MAEFVDTPVKSADEDKLGFSGFARALAKLIGEAEKTPFTVGVFGAWGSGKTTMMHLLREELEGESWQCKTIWFDAWKYDKKDLLWNALIQVILREIYRAEGIKSKLKHSARDLIRRSAKFALRTGIRVGSQGMVSEKVIDDLFKTYGSMSPGNFYDYVAGFEDKFAEVVQEYAGDQKLVVFIDDLDRCLPENAITVLESLKLFLDKAPCVFVLGTDREAMAEAIRTTYEGAELLGRDYLDKIVQVPFAVPVPHGHPLLKFYEELDGPQLNEAQQKLVPEGVQNNLRRIRRFAYAHRLVMTLASEAAGWELKGRSDARDMLVVVTLLRIRFPGFAEACAANPRGLQIMHAWANGSALREQEQFRAAGILDFWPYWNQRREIPDFLKLVQETHGETQDPIEKCKDAEVLRAYLTLTGPIG